MTIDSESIKNSIIVKVISCSYFISGRTCDHSNSIIPSDSSRRWRCAKLVEGNTEYFSVFLCVKIVSRNLCFKCCVIIHRHHIGDNKVCIISNFIKSRFVSYINLTHSFYSFPYAPSSRHNNPFSTERV